MKRIKKILFHGLAGAEEAVLREHLPASAFQCGSDTQDVLWDLVLSGAEQAEGHFGAMPVLTLRRGARLRLGVVLRQIATALQNPVPYLRPVPVGGYAFFPADKVLRGAGAAGDVALTDRETDILAYLARRRGQVVTRDDLLKNVWQYQEGVDTHTLETHIYRLRQKMGLAADSAEVLATQEGGYRLV